MSFSADARVVRDVARSRVDREAALVTCVTRFGPFGLLGTMSHLDQLATQRDGVDRLAAAIDVLDAAHSAWRAELVDYRQRRRIAKTRGCRRVTGEDLTRYATYGWPGDPSGPAAGRALDPEFLRACGMALWEPGPVNLRRRLRRTERALRPPRRFDGCLLLVMAVVLGVLALCSWGVFRPPPIFWYGFGGAALLAVGYAVVHGVRLAAKDAPRHRSTKQALTRRREALAQRLSRAESSS